MKVRMSGRRNEYESKYDWTFFCQGGEYGVVLPSGSFDKIFSGNALDGLSEGLASDECYETAFFEAFPNTPSCFIRGEGKTIEEAEEMAWKKYQKILTCNHEMERRDRTDGYAYCNHCSYSSKVFEPLTKCCKCGKSTAYSTDYKDNYYCKKHSYTKPKNPNPSLWEIIDKRLPRKRKKILKICAKKMFESDGHYNKVKFRYTAGKTLSCDGYRIDILFSKQESEFIKKWK